jgi:hypothetical protein
MSAEIENMTEEEIAKWLEELYELESSAMAGPLISEEEKMARIREFLAGYHRKKRREAAAARREELKEEIAVTSDPKKKERLQRNLELLSGY